jgi:hypothetical protein
MQVEHLKHFPVSRPEIWLQFRRKKLGIFPAGSREREREKAKEDGIEVRISRLSLYTNFC